MSRYQIFTIRNLKSLDLTELNELDLPCEDNVGIGFKKEGSNNISDSILEMIHLVQQLKDIFYGNH